MSDNVVLARRSSWLATGSVILWIAAIVIGIFAFGSFHEKESYRYIMYFLIVLIGAIVYTATVFIIPSVLIEYADGVLYFHPSKSQTIMVKPQDIRYISQKNYSGRGITYASGKMKIELESSEVITLKWISDVDSVRRAIEELKVK